MKIAISTEGKDVSAHFGRCPEFTIVDVKNGKLIAKEIAPNPGHSPGAIPKFLHEKGVSVIIAGGMGMRATQFFEELDIKTIVGISGTVDSAIDALAKGILKSAESLCKPGAGKGYGVEKTECDHPNENEGQ